MTLLMYLYNHHMWWREGGDSSNEYIGMYKVMEFLVQNEVKALNCRSKNHNALWLEF